MDQSPSPVLKWNIALIPCLSQVSSGLAISAVNIAIPTMMASLSASLNQIHWVLTGFLIARTVMMPSVGWLGSRLGNKNLFILSAAVFTGGSFLCSISMDANSLIFFRIIQAIGAGTLQAIAMVIMFEVFPPQERGLAIGVFSGSWSLAIYLGPPLGGYFVEYLHWRAIFYINVVVGLLCMLGAYYLFPQKKAEETGGEFDLIGFLSLTGAIVALLLAISNGRELGWASPLIVFLFASSLVLIPFFVFVELRAKKPYLELHHFRILNFSLPTLLNFFRAFAFRGAIFLVALFLQKGLNFTPLQAGMFLLPGVFLTSIAAPVAGTLSDRLGPCIPVAGGLALLILATYGLSTVTLWTSMVSIYFFIGLYSAGQACLNPPLNTLGLRALPEGKSRMGSGIINMIRGLGESFGVVIMSLLLERQTFLNVGSLSPYQDAYISEATRYRTFSQMHHLFHQAGEYGIALQSRAEDLLSYILFNEAVTRAYQDLFLLIAALYLGLLVISLLFLPKSSKQKEAVGTT
jgi:DHA2 family multidrug resistance protein